MPSEAKLAIFHDQPLSIRSLKALLEVNGHQVLQTAETLKDAEQLIPGLEANGIQVVLVDANLDPLMRDISGNDGRYLVAKIREFAPSVKTIGISITTEIETADYNCTFANSTPEILLDTIKNI